MIDAKTFESEVRRQFDFLVRDYSFSLLDAGDEFTVRYARQDIDVAVSFDAMRSCELTLWIDEIGTNEPPIDVHDVLLADGASHDAIESVSLMQTTDECILRKLLSNVSELLRAHGEEVLRGNPAAIAHVREARAERSAAYTRDVVNAPSIEAADVAWKDSDYETVCDLLSPVRESLDVVHLRRLNYAEKHR